MYYWNAKSLLSCYCNSFGFLCFDDKILTNIKSIFIFFSHARKERQCILFSCLASQLNNLAKIKISKVSICGWIVMKVYTDIPGDESKWLSWFCDLGSTIISSTRLTFLGLSERTQQLLTDELPWNLATQISPENKV